MSKSLSPKEIYDRLIRLRNLERLHAVQKERVALLEEQNKLLSQINAEQAKMIESLKLRVEELEKMVFKKKKVKPIEPTPPDDTKQPPAPRNPASYHRPIPKESDITQTIRHPLSHCPDCHTPLTDKQTRIVYEEDILLSTPEHPLKSVTKHIIEKGYCIHCKTWKSLVPIPSATVFFGPNIKRYISYLSILIRLSFESIKNILLSVYQMDISDGELSKILRQEAKRLTPEYEAIKERIRNQKANHYDETSWKVQHGTQGNHAWAALGVESPEVAFICGQSRGKGVAETIKGKSDHIGISDDYGAYRNLFGEEKHQLCWAHPHRKFRDLTESPSLSEEKRALCITVHEDFAALYRDVRTILTEPFHQEKREHQREALLERLDAISQPNERDPKKLATLKESLRKNRKAYFVCIVNEDVPCDNNAAERALRPLVLKRKNSFGSKTDQGAQVTSVLATVWYSLFRKSPKTVFQEMGVLLGV